MSATIESTQNISKTKKNVLLPVVIMGAGRLGESLLTLGSLTLSGFKIVGVFDKDPKRIGIKLQTPPSGFHIVEPTRELPSRVLSMNVRRGIIAVPSSTAQEAADELINAGIKVILSYAPTDISVPQGILYSRIDPAIQFARLVPPTRFPWQSVQRTFSSSPSSSRIGIARFPRFWTLSEEGSSSAVFNPVLLTLVSNFEDEKKSINNMGAPLGFFEYIQSNKSIFVVQKSRQMDKFQLVGLEWHADFMKETLLVRDLHFRTRGILLFGPSGCGKSTLLKHLTCLFQDMTFYFVSADEDSLHGAFRAAARNEKAAVVIENLDVACTKKSFKLAFLSCADNPSFNMISVLATSNTPWELDPSIIRRFERRLYVSLPNADLRARMLERQFHGCSIADHLRMTDFTYISKLLDGYSTSDVIAVAKDAGLSALKSGENLSREILLQSIKLVRPAFCKELIPLFDSFSQRFATHETVQPTVHSLSYLSMYS